MANPLKILTVLTASQAAKFEQGLDANSQKITSVLSGTAETDAANYGQVTSLSSSMKSYVDAQNTLQDVAANAFSGAIKTYVDAQDAADAAAWAAADSALSGALKTYIDAQDTADAIAWAAADSALSGALKSYVDAEDATFLKLDGSRAMTGNLNASTVQVSASSLNVANAAYVGGNLSVQGNLQVLGTVDAINRTDLQVTDAVILVASGAANAAAADGAGLEVDGRMHHSSTNPQAISG